MLLSDSIKKILILMSKEILNRKAEKIHVI